MPTASPRNARNPRTPWDFIEKQRIELLELDDDALRSLTTSYESAMEKTWRNLRKVTTQIENALERGEPVHPNWLWRQERWTALLVQAGEEAARFGSSAQNTIDRVGITSAHLGGEHAATRLQVAAPDVSFQLLPREALDMMVANLRARAPAGALLMGIAQTAKSGMQGAMYNAIKTELTNGIAVGRNPRDIAESIFNKTKDRVENLTLQRAELIARTESMRMYRGAQTENYRQNDDVVLGWIWVAALNIFTCPACLGKHLSQHPLSEDMHSHPACRCTAMPYVDDEPPNLPFGDDWLRAQSVSDQKKILRLNERWELWRDGKISLADCVTERPNPVWGTNVNVTTLRDLRRIASGDVPSRPNVTWNPLGDPVAKPIETPVAPKRANSKPVSVDTAPRRARILNESPDKIDANADEIVGFDVMDYASGIVTNGDAAKVWAEVYQGRSGPSIDIRINQTNGVHAHRSFVPHKKTVQHYAMQLPVDSRGAGIKAFVAQIQIYRRAGYETVRTVAARIDGSYNGYYTWARFGFDADLTSRFWQNKLRRAGLGHITKISELMENEAGRAWWRENGDTVEMEFDTRDGSYSMNVLELYLAERQAKGTFAEWFNGLFSRRSMGNLEQPPYVSRRDSKILDWVHGRLARARRIAEKQR